MSLQAGELTVNVDVQDQNSGKVRGVVLHAGRGQGYVRSDGLNVP